MSQLAINQGEKTIKKEEPHFTWPNLSQKTVKAVLHQMQESISIYDKSGIIDTLEMRFSDIYRKKHALLTNSGTSALHSLYVGIGIERGDEVICPAYTFFATVTPLFSLGAVPILVDAQKNGNIDPEEIEQKITPKTKAIMVTHMWGLPCNMKKISLIAKRYNLLLLEDASHAFGTIDHGEPMGKFSDAIALSIQGQKTLSGGEGGVLLTNNDDVFYRALMFGHYNKRCKKEIPEEHALSKFAVTGMGLKLRIHPLAAAIANEQLDLIEEVLEGRRRYAKILIEELRSLPGIIPPKIDDTIQPGWYSFVMQYDGSQLENLSIEKFYDALIAEGCLELDRPGSTAPLNLMPLFQQPFELFPEYSPILSYEKGDFPVAETFYKNALKLPVWHREEDRELVHSYIAAFKKVIANYKELL